jgi:heat shock protein HspQ
MKYLKKYESNPIPFGKFKIGDIVKMRGMNTICIITDINYLYDATTRSDYLVRAVSAQPIELKTIKNGSIVLHAYTAEDDLEKVTKVEKENFEALLASVK